MSYYCYQYHYLAEPHSGNVADNAGHSRSPESVGARRVQERGGEGTFTITTRTLHSTITTVVNNPGIYALSGAFGRPTGERFVKTRSNR